MSIFFFFFIFCFLRTILAAIHFNYNLQRDAKIDEQGNPKLKVTYAKFKQGEATVREVRELQNYGNFKVASNWLHIPAVHHFCTHVWGY